MLILMLFTKNDAADNLDQEMKHDTVESGGVENDDDKDKDGEDEQG